jgi:outer membrane lipoprotein carrier protein
MILAFAGSIASAVATPSPSAAADALLRRLEERQRTIKDLEARFVQSYRSGAIGREAVERGTVKIKRPGRMLWEYKEPEKKTFVSDGKTFYFYVPADRQVIVRQQGGERGVAIALLGGEGSLSSQFQPSLEKTPAGADRLRLTPRRPDPDVDHVFVELDSALRVTGLEIYDAQGNRSLFRFEGIRENVGLSDRLFRFEIPKGVEVVSG